MTAARPLGIVSPPSGTYDAEAIAGAARELVDAYGPSAVVLMRKRTHAVRQRGDAESASLWSAVAVAVEAHLAGASVHRAGTGGG